MTKTFVVASVGNRFDGLCSLLHSLSPFFVTGWRIGICLQAYLENQILEIDELLAEIPHKLFVHEEMIGAHPAKVEILTGMSSDIWCSLDDDMEAVHSMTNYDSIANILLEDRKAGFISGNWARNESAASAKVLDYSLVKQSVVYTGGGLVFRDDVADIVRMIPNEQYLFDDCLWSGYAYAFGYDNYRYRGSVAIHRICTSGGRITWLKKNKKDKPLPPAWLFNVKRGTGRGGTNNEYLICSDSELTETAKEMHKKAKKERWRE